MSKTNLALIIPKSELSETAEDNITAINSWLNQFNTVDFLSTANNIINRLEQLNLTIIAGDLRFEILEKFQPLAKLCFENLNKRYINQTQPLSKDKINCIELSKKIHQTLLTGYKIILAEHDFSSTEDPALLANTIYRIFQHSNTLLYAYYQIYHQTPNRVWQEAHLIYQYAMNADLLATPITLDPTIASNQITTITPYKQALFLASINQYSWRQTDQQILYNLSGELTEYIKIRKFNQQDLTNNSGLFFIPIEQDDGVWAFTEDKPFNDITGSTLDLTATIPYCNDYAKNSKKGNVNLTGLANYNVDKLKNLLNGSAPIKHTRFKIAGELLITFGLPSTHYYMNNQNSFNPEAVDAPILDNTTTIELGSNMLENTEEEISFKPEQTIYTASITNINPYGACIIIKNAIYHPIQPVELTAMMINFNNAPSLNQKHWNIGTIEWLKRKDNDTIIGIEIFAPFAIPAAIKIIKNNQPSGYFQRAFLFQNNLNSQFNVITPNNKFDSNIKVKIYSFYHKKFIETELKELLIVNNNFKCFRINTNLEFIK